VLEVVSGLRRVVDEFEDRALLGEIYLPMERLMAYYGRDLSGVHLPFNFQLLQSAWDARGISHFIDRYEGALPRGGWPNWVLGNHDNSRIASRVGLAQARVAAMLLLTLRGTPTLYYGDELGMADVAIPAGRIQDPFEKRVPGVGLGRDPCRTPMQWDDSRHAGFTRGEPWLPVSDDHAAVNVHEEDREPTSFLSLYRKLLSLRRAHPALSLGEYEPIAATGDLLAYIRRAQEGRLLIVLNLGNQACGLSWDALGLSGRLLLSTHLDRQDEMFTDHVELRANEGVIAELPAPGNGGAR
jgi:alpha-glucosidase